VCVAFFNGRRVFCKAKVALRFLTVNPHIEPLPWSSKHFFFNQQINLQNGDTPSR